MDDSKPHAGASWYMSYLRELEINGVPELQRHWCVRRVARFDDILKEKPISTAVRDDVEIFIANLQAAPGTEEWTVRRASDALKVPLTVVYDKCWEEFTNAPPGVHC